MSEDNLLKVKVVYTNKVEVQLRILNTWERNENIMQFGSIRTIRWTQIHRTKLIIPYSICFINNYKAIKQGSSTVADTNSDDDTTPEGKAQDMSSLDTSSAGTHEDTLLDSKHIICGPPAETTDDETLVQDKTSCAPTLLAVNECAVPQSEEIIVTDPMVRIIRSWWHLSQWHYRVQRHSCLQVYINWKHHIWRWAAVAIATNDWQLQGNAF